MPKNFLDFTNFIRYIVLLVKLQERGKSFPKGSLTIGLDVFLPNLFVNPYFVAKEHMRERRWYDKKLFDK